MAMPVLKEKFKPPPDLPLPPRGKWIELDEKEEAPPLASDGNVVAIWKGRKPSKILTPAEQGIRDIWSQILLKESAQFAEQPRLATSGDAVVEDDSEYLAACLAHITPMGLTSVVQTGGFGLHGVPHRIDRINLDEPFDVRKCGQVCTWVGFTQSENPAAWAAAAVRARRRTMRSRHVRARHNKPESTAYQNLAVIGEYTRPPTVEWFLNHPDGRYDHRYQTPWPVGKYVFGHANDATAALHQNKEKYYGEWYSSLSKGDRYLLDQGKNDPYLEEEDIKIRNDLLNEIKTLMSWAFDDRLGLNKPEPALAPTEEVLDLPACVAHGYGSMINTLEHEKKEASPTVVETEKGNPLVCVPVQPTVEQTEPTPLAANEPWIEGEFEEVDEVSDPPSGQQLHNTEVSVSQDQFLVNITLGGTVRGDLHSPKFLEELESVHIPKARAYLDMLVNCKLSAEMLQYGSLTAAMVTKDVNIDGIMDDAEIEMEVERVPKGIPYVSVRKEDGEVRLWYHSDLYTESNKGRLYPLDEYGFRPLEEQRRRLQQRGYNRKVRRYYQMNPREYRSPHYEYNNPDRYRVWERYALEKAEVNRIQRLERAYTEEYDAYLQKREKENRIGQEIHSLRAIGLKQREMRRHFFKQIREYNRAMQWVTNTKKRIRVNLEVRKLREMKAKRDKAKTSFLKKARHAKARWLLKLKGKPIPLFLQKPEVKPYTESVYLTRRPTAKKSGVVAPKTGSTPSKPAIVIPKADNVVVLDNVQTLHKLKSMREHLIVKGLHDLKEVLEHEQLITSCFPELERAERTLVIESIPIVRPIAEIEERIRTPEEKPWYLKVAM